MFPKDGCCISVGRDANVSGVHRHRPDHGLGKQSNRNPLRRVGSPRWRVHAQEGAETQVPLRTERQSVLQQRQERFFLSNLLYDVEQTRDGQLVTSLDNCFIIYLLFLCFYKSYILFTFYVNCIQL